MHDTADPLISRKQASRRTGYSPDSYKTWDCRKTYDLKPQVHRGIVVYRQSIIDAHHASRRLLIQSKQVKA